MEIVQLMNLNFETPDLDFVAVDVVDVVGAEMLDLIIFEFLFEKIVHKY